MLLVSEFLLNATVLSLRTGGVIGETTGYLINPNNLKVEGFWCNYIATSHPLILLEQDIRDISTKGILVNDHDVLSEPEELIRLKDILQLNFTLLNKSVETKNKEKVGKVKDFSIETKSYYVEKLYVTKPIYQNLAGGQISIDRNQIIEVTDNKIIIKELLKPVKAVKLSTSSVSSAVNIA